MKTLRNKVIIVAGGTGGIGRAAALSLARNGAIVVVVSRSVTESDPLMKEIERLSPESASFRGDFAHPETWAKLLSMVNRKYGKLDGLVNCIGVLGTCKLESLHETDVETVVGANCLSVIFGAQAVLPVMRRQSQGVMITVGSLGGMVPMPHASLYCATKHAVRGFSLSLSEELKGTGVEASLLTLGPVYTRMLEAEARNEDCVISFINKSLSPNRVAECILSLLQNPRREIVLPPVTGLLSKLCNVIPGLFGLCYGIFRRVGAIRLQRYRREIA